jgi:hypothetical protein
MKVKDFGDSANVIDQDAINLLKNFFCDEAEKKKYFRQHYVATN